MPKQYGAQPRLTERINYASGFADDKKVRNRIAITGFIFSIVGLLFVVPMFGFLVFPFLALGLIFSIVALLASAEWGAAFRPGFGWDHHCQPYLGRWHRKQYFDAPACG